MKLRYGMAGTAAVMLGMSVVFLPGIRSSKGPDIHLNRELVSLPGGTFIMGSREDGSADRPQKMEVTAFLIGRHEVTVGDYVRYLNTAGSTIEVLPADVKIRRGRFVPATGRRNHPVTGITREDAGAYCLWISEVTGRRVRLPTEAEWEYAARAGIHAARYPWGWGDPKGRARFAARGPGRVGRYAPNTFGLYDMAGNVFEWCAGEAEDGMVPARGGSWAERDPDLLRVSRRVLFPAEYRDLDVGFRIAAEPDEISIQTSY